MIPATTLDAINDVREAFLGVLRELPQVSSFKTLCQTSPEVQERFGSASLVRGRRLKGRLPEDDGEGSP